LEKKESKKASNMEDTITPQKAPQTGQKKHSEPNFIAKLLGKHVKIFMHSAPKFTGDPDDQISGTIVGYNRYELLVVEDECVGPIVVMKNFIAIIAPDDDDCPDPFAKKPKEGNDGSSEESTR
jgi:hypothetical protein